MKDLFSGSLGRLNNHGGSRIFTTPNTREVKPEYEIATNIPSVAEFVTCSLDGRLWVFKRSDRLYIAVLRYDEGSEKLVFVKSEVLSEGNIIGRGIDWILTDKNIIQASDNSPYIRTANLFDDDETSFLYSVLRSKELPSGIDRTTNKAWGLSEDNGNSEGYGYFKRSALLQSVNKHYSLLPVIGDWHIIKNFLVRKADNPLTEAHNSMLNIRPFMPLEFNGSTPIYGCGFDNDIFITHFNGELWGRGLSHIGRCYILPAVFDENGTPQEFYLYISPDYKKSNEITQAEWLNFGVLKNNENTYGFSTAQAGSLDNELCFTSNDPKIFDTSGNQWQQLSENGQMFIDTLNNSGLVLHDNGAIIINTNSYECKGLTQWLAPAGKVDAVAPQYVISSFDDATIATYPQQGFHRELLACKKLSISAKGFSGKRLSLGVADNNSRKKIQVNSNNDPNSAENISWENIYKQPLEIRQINSFICDLSGINSTWPIFIDQNCLDEPPTINGENIFAYFEKHWGCFGYHYYEPWDWSLPLSPGPGGQPGTNSEGVWVWVFPANSYHEEQKLFYIHPQSGELIHFNTIRFSSDNFIPATVNNNIFERAEFFSQNVISDFDIPEEVTIQDGQIGYIYDHCTNNGTTHEERFKPASSIPSEIVNWQNSSLGCLSLQRFHFPKNISENISCPASAVFSERHSNARFLHEIPSVFKHLNGNISGSLASNFENDDLYLEYHNYWNINSLDNSKTYSTQGLHVAIASPFTTDDSSHFFVFRSEIYPEIFDFKAETERSKFS